MLSAQRLLDDNPCRPRHFKPPICAPIPAAGAAGELLEAARTRLLMAAVLFAAIFLVVAGRLVEVVEIPGGSSEPHVAHRLVAPPPLVRADIVDRNGTLLATNLDSPALYVDSKVMLKAGEDPDAAARAITAALPDLSSGEIHAKLASGKSFAYLTRSLTPRQEYAVNNLGIPGVEFQPGEKRRYPLGDLMSHVVGYCSIDNIGQAGIERGLNPTISKDNGKPVTLSLDARVQFVLKDELAQVIDQFDAKGAAGIIMNVHTGEIVAMVSLPDFDPNHPPSTDPKRETSEDKDRIFDKITSGEYELGSVFKIFNTAMALDSGVASMNSVFDATNPIEIGRFTIEDYHGKHRPLSVPEIFAYSSNIGSARMAIAAGADRQKSFLAKLGLLAPVPVEFDKVEVAKPKFPALWREVNVMTIAFGHGIAVTPLHMITATAAMINGGILHPPTMLKVAAGAKVPGERVISVKTSDQIRKLFRLVVESGTAKQAEAPGYVVGGKTGTAEKNLHGRYEEKKLLSSFIGAFPMNDPQYVILTIVDEPHGNKQSHGYATAGWTVAPATGRIIERIAPLLGVAPVDENAPEIVKDLQIESLIGKKLEYN